MVSGKTFKIASAAVIALGLGVTLAYAAADDAIKGRQGCMKASGKMMGAMVPMFKGEQPFDAAVMKAAMDAHDAACADWDKWWGADTQKGETAETWAKPEIWTDPEGFKAAGGNLYNKYVELTKVTDEAGFKAAFPGVGAGCQGCHEKFRRPKE